MTTITPSDIRQGDHLLQGNGTVAWVAQEDPAFTPSGATVVLVQHVPDGGIDARYWDADTDTTFTVEVAAGTRYLTLNPSAHTGPQSTEVGAAVAAAVGDTLGFSAGLVRPR